MTTSNPRTTADRDQEIRQSEGILMNDSITVETMDEHVRHGRALPLLSDGVPGPVQYDDAWWAVPIQARDYRPVTDPTMLDGLNQHVERLAGLRQWVRAREGQP